MLYLPEPSDPHAGDDRCVCTDGLSAYRDESACCDSPIHPQFDAFDQPDPFGWAADDRTRQDEIAEDRRLGCQD
jgi:hypothetical protein